jgi:hypothetical protein
MAFKRCLIAALHKRARGEVKTSLSGCRKKPYNDTEGVF